MPRGNPGRVARQPSIRAWTPSFFVHSRAIQQTSCGRIGPDEVIAAYIPSVKRLESRSLERPTSATIAEHKFCVFRIFLNARTVLYGDRYERVGQVDRVN